MCMLPPHQLIMLIITTITFLDEVFLCGDISDQMNTKLWKKTITVLTLTRSSEDFLHSLMFRLSH